MLFFSVFLVLVTLQVSPVSSTYALSFLSVNSGHRLTLDCPVNGAAGRDVSWFFMYDDRNISKPDRIIVQLNTTSPTHVVQKAEEGDAGRYTCYVSAKTNKDGQIERRSAPEINSEIHVKTKVFEVTVYHKAQKPLLQIGGAVVGALVLTVIIIGLVMDRGNGTIKEGQMEEVLDMEELEELSSAESDQFNAVLKQSLPTKEKTYATWDLHQNRCAEGESDPHYNTVLELQKVSGDRIVQHVVIE